MANYTIDPSGTLSADFESVQEFFNAAGALDVGTFIDDSTPDDVGATLDGAITVTVNASDLVRHDGTANSTAARMQQSSGNVTCITKTSGGAVIVEDLVLEIIGTSTGTPLVGTGGAVFTTNRCVLSYRSTGSAGQAWVFLASSTCNVYNSHYEHVSGASLPFGFNLFNGNEGVFTRNSTFFSNGSIGFLVGGFGSSTAGNTVALRTTAGDCYAFIGADGSGYNMSSDTTAPGATTYENIVPADVLADVSGSSVDTHWISRAVALSYTGVDYTATIGPYDIDKEARVTSPSSELVIGGDYPASPPVILDGTIQAATTLLGEVIIEDPDSSPVLNAVPLVVYGFNVRSADDVAAQNIPVLKRFLVDASFAEGPGDDFYDAGARANYIGFQAESGNYYFRPPVDKELAWFVQIDTAGRYSQLNFYRFFAKSTPVWHLYHPWPERAINGQYAFDILDPDRIYEYYGRLASQMHDIWQTLNRALTRLFTPAECEEDWLGDLALQFAIHLDLTDSVDVQRMKLRELISIPRIRGTVAAFVIPIRHKGYLGTVYEVWVDPEDPDNWDAFIDAPASAQAHMIALGIDDDQVTGNGLKGIDYVVVPHGYFGEVPANGQYYPSPRVAVLISNFDGTPIPVSSFTAQEFDEFTQEIANAVGPLLPAHADIRLFVEVVNVNTTGLVDPVEVDDTITFTDYPSIIDVTPVLSGTLTVT